MKTTKLQELLVEAAERGSPQDFAGFLAQHSGRDAEVDVMEGLQTLPAKLLHRLCQGLTRQVEQAAQALQADLPGDQDGDQQMTGDSSEAAAAAAEALQGVASILSSLLGEHGKRAPEALLEPAAALHDNALLAVPQWPELQEAVARLCQAWWAAEAPGREALVAQALPYLILRALSTGKAADVKRCAGMRGALGLLDFQDAAIGDLKRLLLRAAFAPAFLRAAEGRRFLAHLFTLDPQLVRELGSIVRNQVPAARRSVLDAYGEILFRAWREAAGACALEVETGLAEAAVLASTQPMAAALRGVLDGLHREKAAPEVDALLLRLYQPFLFRHLAAANPGVRRNALGLLLDAFPLQDPDASDEEALALLNRQFACLGDALRDAAPGVRAAACAGMCGLLNTYWEIIPAGVIAGYLQHIGGELAFDGAAAAVRVAALEGLALLAQNPLAQPLVKRLLPGLRPALWDASLAVRAALADFLLTVGAVRDLSFVDVAPLDTLLEAMALDAPPVARALHRLLAPSYFPGPAEGPACVAALLRQAPAAGVAFCRMLVDPATSSAPLEHVLALAEALRDHLLAAAPPNLAGEAGSAGVPSAAGARKAAKRRGKRATSAEAPQDGQQVLETPEAWQAMLEGLAALCGGLGAAAAAGDLAPDQAAALFGGGQLPALLALCTTAAARAAVLDIAAALPECEEAEARCVTHLLASSSCTGPELRAGLRCAAAAGALGPLLDRILAAVEGEGNHDAPEGEEAMSAESALRCLGAMLADESLRLALLSSEAALELLPALRELAGACAAALATSLPQQEGPAGVEGPMEPDLAARLALPAASLAARLALHLQLTSALVAAAEVAAAEEQQDALADAGIGQNPGGQPAPEHMWSAVGWEAVEEALDRAALLLARLRGADWGACGSGQAGAESPSARAPKRGRKARASGARAAADSPDAAAAAQAASQVVLWTLALSADAARLLALPAGACMQQRQDVIAQQACALAADCVAWAASLADSPAAAALVDAAELAAPVMGHAARLAACLLGSRTGAADVSGAAGLAAMLLETGAVCKESWPAAALKPHLQGLLGALSSQEAAEHPGWLQAAAQAMWQDAPHDIQPVSKQGKGTEGENENVPGNVPRPAGRGRKSAALPDTARPFLKALLQAGTGSKVQPALARQAAQAAAAAADAGSWESCAGAVKLTGMLGADGAGELQRFGEHLESTVREAALSCEAGGSVHDTDNALEFLQSALCDAGGR